MSKKFRFSYTLDEIFNKYLSKDWMIVLKNLVEAQKVKKNETIFSEGDPVKGIYFINSGKIKVTSKYDDSNDRILRLSHGGHLLGHRALTSKVYPISAVALTEAQVTFIPIDVFHKLILNNPAFAMYLINFISQDLKDSEIRMKGMIHSEVIVRIAIILCMLADTYGFSKEKPNQLNFLLHRSDIANMAGTTYESVIRNLAKLEEMKIISLDSKNISILKRKELQKIADNKI